MPGVRPTTRSRRLNLRATARQAKLIRLGADLRGTNVSSFVLESACMQAEQALADRRAFALGAADWQRFMRALDRPSREKPALRSLLERPSVLEERE
jgi:uncharacterized protein (DUF1778 family)